MAEGTNHQRCPERLRECSRKVIPTSAGMPIPYRAARLCRKLGTSEHAPFWTQRRLSSALMTLDANSGAIWYKNFLSTTCSAATGARWATNSLVAAEPDAGMGASGKAALGYSPADAARVVFVCAITGDASTNKQAIKNTTCIGLGFMFRSKWRSELLALTCIIHRLVCIFRSRESKQIGTGFLKLSKLRTPEGREGVVFLATTYSTKICCKPRLRPPRWHEAKRCPPVADIAPGTPELW